MAEDLRLAADALARVDESVGDAEGDFVLAEAGFPGLGSAEAGRVGATGLSECDSCNSSSLECPNDIQSCRTVSWRALISAGGRGSSRRR